MGYSSDIGIAVHKTIVAEDLISPIIPEILRQEPHHDTELARYWKLEGWKWYASFPEVSAIESFFSELNERESISPNLPEPGPVHSIGCYGAMRIGEDDDDVQEWGDPCDYDIHLSRTIDWPFTDSPADDLPDQEPPCATSSSRPPTVIVQPY